MASIDRANGNCNGRNNEDDERNYKFVTISPFQRNVFYKKVKDLAIYIRVLFVKTLVAKLVIRWKIYTHYIILIRSFALCF